MMTFNTGGLARLSAAFLLGLSLAGTPAFADKGGNGGGNGNAGGNGNSGNSNAGGNSNSNAGGNGKSGVAQGSSKSAAGQTKVATATATDTNASAYGKLNGFLHASPKALAKASPNSAIGKVAKIYAGLLNSYLNPLEGATPPTAEEVAAALAAAANKPLTADVIAKVNDKLIATNADLAASLTLSGKTAADLATEIAAAL